MSSLITPTDAPPVPHDPAECEPAEQPRSAQVRIVVGSPKIWKWPGLKRCFPRRDGYILLEGDLPLEPLLFLSQSMAPCVLILDHARLENCDPAEFASLVDFGRAIQVLIYGASREDAAIQSLVRMGCMGFFGPEFSASQLKKAVRALAAGELWLDRRFISGMVKQFLVTANAPRLTPREREVLELISRGFRNREIAEKLFISHETVRWHVRTLHSKLGTQDRLSTAAKAREMLRASG